MTKPKLLMGMAALVVVSFSVIGILYYLDLQAGKAPPIKWPEEKPYYSMEEAMAKEVYHEPPPPEFIERAQGEWTEGGRLKYRVVCSDYGTTDYDENPDVLKIHFFVESQANGLLRLGADSFYVEDDMGRKFHQVSTYRGSHHFKDLTYEKLNPGTTKKYTFYVDIPGESTYRFYSSNNKYEYTLLKPEKNCLAKLIESYDLTGIEKRLKSKYPNYKTKGE